MVKISPISGITYNLDKLNINNVIAPPYDVISEKEQEELYAFSPYNIVKLILGKISPFDNESDNRYTRASALFREWLNAGMLVRSNKPCIYYLIQNYTTEKGDFISRKGFIANNYIEEFSTNQVLPHEYTMGGPKEDRLKLMKECGANFSQIFMVYSDPCQEIDKAFVLPDRPAIDVEDKHGVRNILYIIDDEIIIKKVCSIMQDKTLLIADGHHRYETSIVYRDYMRSLNPDYDKDAEFNYVMCYYTNLDDENLKVYPTHRIITAPVNFDKLINKLTNYFDMAEYSFSECDKDSKRELFIQELENSSKDNIVFGAYFKNINQYYLFKLRNTKPVNEILERKGVPDVLKKLDLIVLHKIVITDFLNISDEDQMKQNGVKYIKKEEEAFEAVENNSAELVFIMASPKIKDIKNVSQEGYRMPQKSTYFYPKLLSGLVINPL